ncbi:MAG: hypothetical protein ABSB15_21155 [Bryobacteraceae bacterium]
MRKARDTRLTAPSPSKSSRSSSPTGTICARASNAKPRAASSLKHPNICVLFDIGKQHGIDFMVLEHLEGERLAARVSKGPLLLDQVLKYAMQIADALDPAHRERRNGLTVVPETEPGGRDRPETCRRWPLGVYCFGATSSIMCRTSAA